MANLHPNYDLKRDKLISVKKTEVHLCCVYYNYSSNGMVTGNKTYPPFQVGGKRSFHERRKKDKKKKERKKKKEKKKTLER